MRGNEQLEFSSTFKRDWILGPKSLEFCNSGIFGGVFLYHNMDIHSLFLAL